MRGCHLTTGQLADALRAFRACEALNERGASGIDATLIEVIADAMDSIAHADREAILGLPLDEFIDSVRDVFVAALEFNAGYLAEKVVPALNALTEVLGAAKAVQTPAAGQARG